METGDILLFVPKKQKGLYRILDWIIESFSDSKYTHVAMVWKDPVLLDREQLKGFYIIESTGREEPDVEDGKKKFGVQLRNYNEVLRNSGCDVYWRKLNCIRDQGFHEKMNYAHSVVHGKPYDIDPVDWIDAAFDLDIGNLQKKNTFFCSALCSFILICLGAVSDDVQWSKVRPKDLGTEDIESEREIKMQEGFELENEKIIYSPMDS